MILEILKKQEELLQRIEVLQDAFIRMVDTETEITLLLTQVNENVNTLLFALCKGADA